MSHVSPLSQAEGSSVSSSLYINSKTFHFSGQEVPSACSHVIHSYENTFTFPSLAAVVYIFAEPVLPLGSGMSLHMSAVIKPQSIETCYSQFFCLFLYFLLPLCVFLLLSLLSSSLLELFPSAPRWQLDYHVSMQRQKLAARQNSVLSHPWLLQCDEGQQTMTLGTSERSRCDERQK